MTQFQNGVRTLSQLPSLSQLSGTVAVVGASGLVGTALMHVLTLANASRAQPLRLLAISRRPHMPTEGIMALSGDVGDRDFVTQLPPIDWLFYLAGSTSNFRERPQETIATGALGVSHFLEAGHGQSGFVFASSTRVYGRFPGDGWLEEDHAALVQAMDPDNLYDCAKRLGESLCLQFSQQGRPAKVARLTNLYGPHLAMGSTTSLSDWIREGTRQGRVTLKGHPDSVRNHCFVLDAVQGLLLAAIQGQAGQAYNVGSHEHFSNHALARLVADHLGVPLIQTGAHGTPSVTRISLAKAQRELGFDPRFQLAQLLPELIANEVKPPCTTSPN